MFRGISVLLVAGAAGVAVVVGASAAAAPRVSLQVRPTAITYGQQILLKGKIPVARAKEQVVVKAHMCTFTGAVPIRTLKTRKGGAFSFRVGPTLKTAYSVSWGKSRSRTIVVGVAPELSLDKAAAHVYHVSVSAGGGSSFGGKHALLQRRAGTRWVTVGRVPLKLTSPPDALNSVSSGTVQAHVKHKTLLRAVLPLAQARPCYRAGVSDTVSA